MKKRVVGSNPIATVNVPCPTKNCAERHDFEAQILSPDDLAVRYYVDPPRDECQSKICKGCGKKVVFRGCSLLLTMYDV